MGKKLAFIDLAMILLVAIAGVTGCQNKAGGEGVQVMFKGIPKIHHADVYHHGRVVGSILDQSAAADGTSMVTIRVASDHREQMGRHWAFYVDRGRLTAGRLGSSGASVKPGDRMLGFHSKAAYNWFKVKTLLKNRVSEAGRRAEKLHRRFTQSG